MMTWAIVAIAAMLLGIAAGLMPGVGMSMVVISAFPILKHLNIYQVFFFYIVLDSTMQYYGSISAIVFGIMGETTSAPAVYNGHELFRQGHGDSILTATATSSFIASVFGIIVFWMLASHAEVLVTMLSGKIKSVVLFSVLMILAWLSSNRLMSLILIAAGLVVGSAGSDIVTWARVIFPQYSMFDGGIPFAPLMTGFIVVPAMITYMRRANELDQSVMLSVVNPVRRLRYLLNISHIWSTVRGTLVGCFCGAIPGVSYSISSNLAESVEKFLHGNTTTKSSMTKNLLAAEAANNSGAIVVLAPLILFSIPIIPSESLILSLAESNGFTYMAGMEYVSKYLYHILGVLVGINLINWLCSGFCYKYISDLYAAANKYGYHAALVICVVITIFGGIADFQLELTRYVLVASSLVGMIIQRDSVKMTFIFAFFVAGELMPELYRQYLIYFT